MVNWQAWKDRASALKREVIALYLACRDPRTPLMAKVFAALVAAYALSPIDLIPDFIPVLGYLDDLILLPLGVLIAIKLIPPQVMADSREQAETLILEGKPVSRWGALIVIGLWVGAIALMGVWLWRLMR